MSFALIKLSDDPIVLLRAELAEIVEGDQLTHVKTGMLRELAGRTPPLYVIWDLRYQDIMVYAIQLLIYDAQDYPPGSIADRRLNVLIVGDHPVIAVLLRKAREDLDTELSQFDSVDEALSWVHQQSTRQN